MRSRLIPAVLLSALVIYLIGIYTGWYITNNQMRGADAKIQEIEGKLNDIREWTTASDQRTCPILESQFQNQVKELSLFWSALPPKIETSDVSDETLRSYVELEVEAYFVGESLEQQCGRKLNLVLYFPKRGDANSVEAGRLIDKSGKGAMILTMPVDVNSTVVSALAKSFNITNFPAVRTCTKTLTWPFTEDELSIAISECNS
ncbi:MAG: hypothetical protein J7L23_03455 [Candidatus Diapherotrites archaeon]|nr:hypothetical protein [Candidatus Diapherotrites archaeon]